MPVVKLALALAAAALVHFAGVRLWPAFPLAVDPFLVVAVAAGRSGRPVPAMFAGMAAGWATDALAGGMFGLHGLADTVVGFGTARAAQQLVVQRRTSLAAVFAAAAAAQTAILALLSLVFPGGYGLPSPFWLIVKVATTAALGLAWTALAAAVSRGWSARRRKPGSGIWKLPG